MNKEEVEISTNKMRKEFGLEPITGGDALLQVKTKSDNEIVEIKRQNDSWQEMREMGIEIKNESIVFDIVNLMIKSELSYLESNEALREADRALRHKALAKTLK